MTISGSGKYLDVAGLSTANGAKLYTNGVTASTNATSPVLTNQFLRLEVNR